MTFLSRKVNRSWLFSSRNVHRRWVFSSGKVHRRWVFLFKKVNRRWVFLPEQFIGDDLQKFPYDLLKFRSKIYQLVNFWKIHIINNWAGTHKQIHTYGTPIRIFIGMYLPTTYTHTFAHRSDYHFSDVYRHSHTLWKIMTCMTLMMMLSSILCCCCSCYCYG